MYNIYYPMHTLLNNARLTILFLIIEKRLIRSID